MKKPNIPKSFADLFVKHKNSILDIYSLIQSPLHKEEYLHWDDVQYKTPPGNLSNEQYWLGLKLRRDPLKQQVPLIPVDGIGRFSFVQPNNILKLLHEIDMKAGGRIEMPQAINPETKNRYYINSLIEEGLTSSQLEGAVVTRTVAKEMIKTGRKPRSRDEQMVLNNYLTMRRIGELRNEKLSRHLVFEIHRIITDDSLPDPNSAGRFRLENEQIVVGAEVDEIVYHRPPPASELDDRMKVMCDFANEKGHEEFIHPVLRAIILHFWLAYDHPFVDGNGRTARALFYWSMLRHRYWLFEFVSISRIIKQHQTKYYKAFLFTETDDNDLTYFIHYHLEVMCRAIRSLYDYLNRKTDEGIALEREIKSLTQFNYRQRALLSHALRHLTFIYTVNSHKSSHNIATQTARSDLLQLQQLGLLSATRNKLRYEYKPVPEFEQKLKALAD